MLVKIWGAQGSTPSPIRPEEIREKLLQAMLNISQIADNKLREKVFAAIFNIAAERSSAEFGRREILTQYLDSLTPLAGSTASGNTPCVEVRSDSYRFIIDAGSGIRELGMELMKGDCGRGKGVLHLLFSHPHWDHIQGFPFFRPAFIPGNKIFIYSVHDMEAALRRQQEAISFPVPLEFMQADMQFNRIKPEQVLEFGDLRIRNICNKHPGDAYSYRFEKGNKVFVYASDASYPQGMDLRPYLNFFADADMLIFDTQFTQRESDEKEDWGHSSSFFGVEVAQQANVKQLVLFHYDPTYTDENLENILTDTLKFQENQYPTDEAIEIVLACEGQTFDLTPSHTTDLQLLPEHSLAIIRPQGVFNDYVAHDLKLHIERLSEQEFPTQIIIDMAAVNLLQVAGLRMLVKLRKDFASITMVLSNPSANVAQLIELAGYKGFFAIHNSVEEAIHALEAYSKVNLLGYMVKEQYTIERKLGDGRLGTVFKATDINTEETVALKVLSPSFSQEAIQKFVGNAQQLLELDHPNIVHILACEKDKAISFMVEEFIESYTLTDLLTRQPNQQLPLTVALDIAEGITRALAYAHAHGVIHGDFKPKNVLLNDDGTLKVSDFGIGRLESGKSLLNIDLPLAFVTARYLAPEQVLGQPMDIRTDIYAFGIILYELFTGRPPFIGPDKEVLEMHLSSPPRPPRDSNPHISPTLEHMVLKMLDKEPNRRYTTMHQIEQILHSFSLAEISFHQLPQFTTQRRRPFINRTAPLQQLQDFWQVVKQGVGQCVFMQSEAGQDKSQLLSNFICQIQPQILIRGICTPQTEQMPYAALIKTLKQNLRRTPTKVTKKNLGYILQQMAAVVPTIRTLFADDLALHFPAADDSAAASSSSSPQTVDLSKLLRQASASTPWLLVLENIHWIDSSSLHLLDYLLNHCPDMSIMVVLTYEPEQLAAKPLLHQQFVERHANIAMLTLTGLNEAETEQLLNQYWPHPPEESDWLKAIYHSTGGNPLHIIQMAQNLLAEGVVTQQNGSWEFMPISEINLPESITTVVQQRMGHLGSEVQTLLQQAAVLGQQFTATQLFEISYLTERGVLSCLDVALENRFVQAEPQGGNYWFVHPQVHHAVYQSLNPLERRQLHQQAGEMLERLHPDKPSWLISILAQHFDQANIPEKILHYGRRAAEHAQQMEAHQTALEWYNKALEMLKTLDPSEASAEQFDLLAVRERIYKRLQQTNKQVADIVSLRRVASVLDDPARRAIMHHRWAAFERQRKRMGEATLEAQAGLAAARQANDPQLRGESLMQLANIALSQQQIELARKEFDTAQAILMETDDHRRQVRVLNGLGRVARHAAEYQAAATYHQQALTVAQQHFLWSEQAASLHNLGLLQLAQNNLTTAERYCQQASKINRLVENYFGEKVCQQTLKKIRQKKPG